MSVIAFAGLGRMGWPMAARLVAAGHALRGLDAVPGRAAAFAAEVGGEAAADEAAAARGAEIIITMLPTSREVASVLGAMRGSLARDAVVIEMSSGEPSATQALARDFAPLGVTLVDAPVSGGVARAKDGTLAIMTGGDTAALSRVDGVLRAMGGSVTRCGDVGAGQAMKALNNLVSAAGFLIGTEALLIGSRFGLDAATMEQLHRPEQQHGEEVRAVRALARLRFRLRARPDGEGPVHRAAGGAGDGDADAARRAVPGTVGCRGDDARPGPGPHGGGALQRAPGGQRDQFAQRAEAGLRR
jgi:3-hydroxyisobutyrate dehydrogenase-like beta-hydroxyacid dehydrogenase